ncbi:MAG: hypothetical protein IT371_15340 [Deltaproteobacteria bacterium]|nr:hypothetical protein [Deltaproteobacteria bacterium]
MPRLMVGLLVATLASLPGLARAQTAPDEPAPGGPPPEQPAPAAPVTPPASPTPTAPGAVSAPPPGYAYGNPAHLLLQDPEYRAGRRMRLGGILTTAIGGGVGLLWASMFFVFSTEFCAGGSMPIAAACGIYRNMGIIGLVITGVSLAVGLPLLFVGHGQVKRAESRLFGHAWLPRLDLVHTPGGATLLGRWVF